MSDIFYCGLPIIIFPAECGIVFHYFHHESDEYNDNPVNRVNPVKRAFKMKKFKSYWLIIFIFLLIMACGEDERITAFKNVHLVPMTGEKIVESQTVQVKGDRIFKIGPSNQIKIPRNAKVIDGRGAYLMPGMADMHVHLRNDWPLSQLDMYLAHGVTTIRDLGGKEFMRQWRDEIKMGKRSGPTIYAAAPIIYGYEQNSPDLLAEHIPGYDCIKLYSYFSKEDFHKAMQNAKKFDLYTVGHIPFTVGLDGVISEGMDEIAHVEELSFEFIDFDRTRRLQPKDWLPYVIKNAMQQNKMSSGFDIDKINNNQKKRFTAVLDKLKSANIPVCTTLIIDDVIVQKLFEPEKFMAHPQSKYLPVKYKQALMDGKEKHQVQFKGIESLAPFKYQLDKALLVELHRAGIPLVLGTDAGTGTMGIVPGFSLHDELRILVENGFTPYEAIKTGTVNASEVAAAMTGRNDFGTIEVGKRADFILVNKNPLEDVAYIKDNRGVMAAGEWYETAYLRATISPALLPGIPIEGNVIYVRRPDNSFNTDIEIIVGDNFRGKLPDDIDSITASITDSNGITSSLTLPQYRYFEQLRDFSFSLDGPPAIGKYTFTVTSKGLTGTVIDFQTINRTIPRFDINTLSPAEGQILTSKTPNFAWAPVEYPDIEIYYRLIIEEPSGKRVYGTGRVQNMLSHTVPEDILKAGQTYRWRVRSMDSEDWVEMQNRSDSKWLSFTIAEKLDDFRVLAKIYNACESDNSFRTHIDITIGADFTGKLPDDIDSITITGPQGNLPIEKDDFTYFPQFRDFWIGIPGSPEIGTYTFTVTSGNTKGSATDTQSMLRSLPVPDTNTLSPANGETLTSKTSTFSWGAVEYPDVPIYYRLEIWNPSLTERAFASKFAKNMSYTVPTGKLQPGRTYIWRVQVFDSISWDTYQNRGSGEWQTITMAKKLE
jgi:hypothetical protein